MKPQDEVRAPNCCEWYGKAMGKHEWHEFPEWGFKRCAKCKHEMPLEAEPASPQPAQKEKCGCAEWPWCEHEAAEPVRMSRPNLNVSGVKLSTAKKFDPHRADYLLGRCLPFLDTLAHYGNKEAKELRKEIGEYATGKL